MKTLHRLVLPIQTRGGLGKSTEAIVRGNWMTQRDVDWQGFDLDIHNRTFSTAFNPDVPLIELGDEPEMEVLKLLRKIKLSPVTVIDPQAHQDKLILKCFKTINFPELAKAGQIRATVLLFPMDELSDMDNIDQTVEELGSSVDWLIVRNPHKSPKTKFFTGSELEKELLENLGASELVIPALMSDTRNYLRGKELELNRAITPSEALGDTSLKLDVMHKTILQNWTKDLFQSYDRLAHILVPTDKAEEIKASRIAKVEPTAKPEEQKRKRGVNLAAIS